MKIRKAVIPAAGLGTRFLPATKAQPKEMLPIVDKPTLQYVVEEAAASGIEEVLIVIGRNKNSIQDHFDKSVELELELERKGKTDLLEIVRGITGMVRMQYVRQVEPRGLGHAVYCARSFIGDEPFAVLLGDDIVYAEKPCLRQMMDIYERFGASVLGVQEVSPGEVDKYGIIDGKLLEERLYRVDGLVEKPDPGDARSNVAVLGRYIIDPAIFGILEKIPPGRNGEIQLTDALRELSVRQSVYAYMFEGRRYDVGDRQGFIEATVEYGLRNPELRQGLLSYLQRLTREN